MEDFFTPCRRLRDQNGFNHFAYVERELVVPIQTFLDHQWDWSDFRAFAATGEIWKILWIAEDTFISVEGPNAGGEFNQWLGESSIQRAMFTVPCGETHTVVLAHLSYNASLEAGAFSILWRVVTTSNCVQLKLENTRRKFGPCSDPALPHFLEASPSLRLVELKGFDFKGADCLTLVTLNRTDLKVNFDRCSFSFDLEFLENSIMPRLEMNRNCFEHQRQALTRADHAIRGQLLARALHVVRYNPDQLFRFLSENVPAFVRSD
jgi:hypothetical protein